MRVRTTSIGVHTVSAISAAREPQTRADRPLTVTPSGEARGCGGRAREKERNNKQDEKKLERKILQNVIKKVKSYLGR